MKTIKTKYGCFNEIQKKICFGGDFSFETALKIAVRHRLPCLYAEELEYSCPESAHSDSFDGGAITSQLTGISTNLYFWSGKIISIDEAIAFYSKMFGENSQQVEFFREQSKEQAVYFLEKDPRISESETDRTYFLFLRRFNRVEYVPFAEVEQIINF